MNKTMKFLMLAGVAMTAMSTPALADDLGGVWSKERFQLRLRAIGVLADGDGTVTGTTLATDVDDAYVPEVDITYYFTPNVAAELIAATSNHNVDAGTSNLGDAWILPPTLTLQYHFMPDNKFSPYIGAGVNYSTFYSEDSAGAFTNLKVHGGWGWAAQIGSDFWLNDHWGLNLDVKYIDLEVDVDVDSGGTHLTADNVDLNPWVVGAGISYRF